MYGKDAPERLGGDTVGLAQAGQVRNPQIGGAVERHAKGLAELHHILTELRNRLEPVLRPMPPEPKGNEAKDTRGPTAPIAGVLHKSADDVDKMAAIGLDILNRLEL